MAPFRVSFILAVLIESICHGSGHMINRNPHKATVRVLNEEDRHEVEILENDIGSPSHVPHHPNPVILRNSVYSDILCSPDSNGYYGSTAGAETDVTFGFGVETTPGTNMTEVFHAVHESVESALLSAYFPTLCRRESSRRLDESSRRLDAVTGFRFASESNQHAGKCTPLEDETNSCDMFISTVGVYGESHDALAVIRDHLDESDAKTFHPHIERIFSITLGDDAGIVSTPPASDNGGGLSRSATAGIVVAVLTLSVGLIVLAVFEFRRRGGRLSRTSQATDLALDEGQDVESQGVESEEAESSLESEIVDLETGKDRH